MERVGRTETDCKPCFPGIELQLTNPLKAIYRACVHFLCLGIRRLQIANNKDTNNRNDRTDHGQQKMALWREMALSSWSSGGTGLMEREFKADFSFSLALIGRLVLHM